MKKVIIVHGWGGHPNIYWLPFVRKQLEAKGFEVLSPQMPNTDNPNQSEWVAEITKAAGNPSENIFFIGHSLGCPAILRYIETLPEDKKVGGAVLVCGFTEQIGYPEPDSFVQVPFDYEKLKRVGGKIIALNSDNDSYIPVHHAEVLRNRLGAELIMMPGAGHMNDNSGHHELPEAVEALLKIAE